MSHLKLILGGVALAATGYGLKKYFDTKKECEEFDWSSEPKDVLREMGSKACDGVINALDSFEAGAEKVFKKVDKWLETPNEEISPERAKKREERRKKRDESIAKFMNVDLPFAKFEAEMQLLEEEKLEYFKKAIENNAFEKLIADIEAEWRRLEKLDELGEKATKIAEIFGFGSDEYKEMLEKMKPYEKELDDEALDFQLFINNARRLKLSLEDMKTQFNQLYKMIEPRLVKSLDVIFKDEGKGESGASQA